MKTRNPITGPTLTVAQLIHDLAAGPAHPADVLSRLEGAFDVLLARDPCQRMRATYTADLERIKALHQIDMNGETASERRKARDTLRTLADDYRNVAQDDPKDDAAQDELLSNIVARAALERGLTSLRPG